MNIVNDYLSSTYCLDSFSNLVVEQALKDGTTVLPGTQDLLMRFLKTEYEYLDGLFGQMLIDVAWCEPVKNAMFATMSNQIVDQL